LKSNGKYDAYVKMHFNAMMTLTPAPGDPPNPTMTFRNAAHSGPSFFPWHREFILRFEKDLAIATGNPLFALPYWRWAADGALAPGAAAIWGVDLMGGDGAGPNNEVATGSFRSPANGGTWQTVELDMMGNPLPAGALQRTLGRGTSLAGAPLPSEADVTAAEAVVPYDVANFSRDSPGGFRVIAEGWHPPGMHNRVHLWVGGSMEPGTSPNDPVFFLHHCNVDRIWNEWQRRNGGLGAGYLPLAGGPSGHNLHDMMFPWNTAADTRTPADVVSSLTLGYKYDTDP
jgi:hypothetical protein